MHTPAHQTVPGLDISDSRELQPVLQQRLTSLLDLQLTLKHVHWNVIGPDFIAVHEMLDEHVDGVRAMSDEVAERIRTLGGEPVGTPGFITETRSWHDYRLGRAPVNEHLTALDTVYDGVITDHRAAIQASAADPVSEDMLIGQTGKLELYQWFVRSFIEAQPPAAQPPAAQPPAAQPMSQMPETV